MSRGNRIRLSPEDQKRLVADFEAGELPLIAIAQRYGYANVDSVIHIARLHGAKRMRTGRRYVPPEQGRGWDAETEAAAVAALKEGCTALEVAQRLNRAFGTRFSRNSIVGKAHRMGWELNSKGGGHQRVSVGKVRAARVAKKVAALTDKPLAIDKKARNVDPRTTRTIEAPEVEASNVVPFPSADHPYRQIGHSIEIPPGHLCHYPFGDARKGNLVYCGAPVDPTAAALERPYCAKHFVAMRNRSASAQSFKARTNAVMARMKGEFA